MDVSVEQCIKLHLLENQVGQLEQLVEKQDKDEEEP